ncbi:MAG: tetratricopeptide repeat protein [Caldilineaceae bacterium]
MLLDNPILNAMCAAQTLAGKLAAVELTPRYRLLNRLGAGGMGDVYRAYDRLSGETVALKRVPVDATRLSLQLRTALSTEFQTLTALHHPNIISVNDYGFDSGGQPFFTMELLERPQTLIESGQWRNDDEKIDLLAQLLRALSYLHRRQLVHRDLKPGNVLVKEQQVKVLDFGLAAIGGVTSQSGTLNYMAPETLRGEQSTPSADLYAVGILAYELFAGWHPFAYLRKFTVEELLQAEADWQYLDLPPQLLAVLQRLLAKAPQDRYPDAAAAIEALAAVSTQPILLETVATRESFLQSAPFVGRQAELAQLSTALEQAWQGQSRGWLIGGESGVGKSRLIDQIRTQALVKGGLVLRGQAQEGGSAYHLWLEALRWLLLSGQPTLVEAAIFKPLLPTLETFLEQSIVDAPVLEANAALTRLRNTLFELFQRTAQLQPIVLLLADLHWADQNSLDLLRWLLERMTAQSVQPSRLLLIADYRSDEMPDLLASLPGMHSLSLQRLNSEAVGELSQAILGHAGQQPHLLTFLQQESEGNTFFMVEVLRSLAEEAGLLDRVTSIPLPGQIFPGGIRQLLQRRLQRVGTDDQPLLRYAAVAGRQLDLPLLRSFAPADLEFDGWLVRCANAALLEAQEGRWRFNHDKLREGILNELHPADRAQTHQAIALRIEVLYASQLASFYGDLAYHYGQAGATAAERRYLLLAAEQAQRLYANNSAISYYERLLNLVESEHERGDLLLRLGQVFKLVGRWSDSENLFHQALALSEKDPDRALLIASYQAIGGLARSRGDNQEAVTWLEKARALCDQAELQEQFATVLLELGNVHYQLGNYREAAARLEEAMHIGQHRQDERIIGLALHALGNVAFDTGDYVQTRDYYERALLIRRRLGDQADLAATIANLGILSWYQGQLDQALDYYEEARQLREQTGDRANLAIVLNNRGIIYKEKGDAAAALADYEAALEIHRLLGNKTGISYVYSNIAALHSESGNVSEAQRLYEETLAIRRAIGDRWGIASTLSHLGNVATAQNHLDDANRYFSESLRLLREFGDKQKVMYCLAGLAEVALLTEQTDRAIQLAAAAKSIAQHHNLVMERDTLQRFEASVAVLHTKVPAPKFETYWEQGAMLSLEAAIELAIGSG